MWSNARCSYGKPACDRAVSPMHRRALRGSDLTAIHAHRGSTRRDAGECSVVRGASTGESLRPARYTGAAEFFAK